MSLPSLRRIVSPVSLSSISLQSLLLNGNVKSRGCDRQQVVRRKKRSRAFARYCPFLESNSDRTYRRISDSVSKESRWWTLRIVPALRLVLSFTVKRVAGRRTWLPRVDHGAVAFEEPEIPIYLPRTREPEDYRYPLSADASDSRNYPIRESESCSITLSIGGRRVSR